MHLEMISNFTMVDTSNHLLLFSEKEGIVLEKNITIVIVRNLSMTVRQYACGILRNCSGKIWGYFNLQNTSFNYEFHDSAFLVLV